MTKTQREALKKIVEGPSKIYFNDEENTKLVD